MVTTALRSVCGTIVGTVRRRSNPNIRLDIPHRSIHTSPVQPRQSQNLPEWFSEVFPTQPRHAPDSIYKTMNMIHPTTHSSVTPFSLLCRTVADRWTIKGVRIGAKDATHKRSVVIVAGNQARERAPIAVSLYVAEALSKKPIDGVEVTVFPVMKPKEYEIQWRSEQIRDQVKQFGFVPAGGPIMTALEQPSYGVEGPLRSYVMKRGTNYIDLEMDLDATNAQLHLRGNSLQRPLSNADYFLATLPPPPHPSISMPSIAGQGDTTLFGALASPPTVVLELRDKQHCLSEDEISVCGDRVLAAIEKLVADTSNPRRFVL